MPRLLLVDDNPSIHKIAETLLSSSPIELVCVESGSEAMMLLDSGERFDVALLDTVMPGMDGWELLSRMRKHPESAFIPIAMMAGVLDTVNPDQLSHAPIQGFLKKPIELRELADRVHQLLATPVTLAERGDGNAEPSVLSPFSTVPGTKMSSLPEFRSAFPEGSGAKAAVPGDATPEDDLLILTPEDFWPGESAPAALVESSSSAASMPFAEAAVAALMEEAPRPVPVPVQVPDLGSALDLEELDLEALKDLHTGETPAFHEPAVVQEIHAAPESPFVHGGMPAPIEEAASLPTIDLTEQETLAIPGLPEVDIGTEELPDLGEVPDFESMVAGAPPAAPSMLIEPSHEPSARDLEAAPLPVVPDAPLALMPPATAPAEERSSQVSSEVVQTLLSDPALLDALAKAVVAKLGDQVLREIAWEVMPELAEKLPR